MKIIGITGGIGAGKTTVCKIFETLGVPVYYADERARLLMQHDKGVVDAVKDLLGKTAYAKDGSLNKDFVAEQIFNHTDKLKQLNAIVHPATIQDALKWAEKQSAPYVLKETALMFETKAFQFVDKVIGVSAPITLRISRTMQRNGISEKEVLKRMDEQMDEDTKMSLCDFVIFNDEQSSLVQQVLKLHKRIKSSL